MRVRIAIFAWAWCIVPAHPEFRASRLYVNGCFGFSVQKEIYLSVGGKPDGEYDQEAWRKFGDRVGWRVKENWISYDEVIFDTTAPDGHLPLLRTTRYTLNLFSRIETCKL